MELIIAVLAGICPDWWPWGRHRRPRWQNWPPIPDPIPDPQPGPDPSPIDGKPQPDPWRPIDGKPQPNPWGPIDVKPRPDPWILLGGIACGLGGAIAWLAVGRDFGGDVSILAPAVTGFLGGTTAGWAVDSVRDMIGAR